MAEAEQRMGASDDSNCSRPISSTGGSVSMYYCLWTDLLRELGGFEANQAPLTSRDFKDGDV